MNASRAGRPTTANRTPHPDGADSWASTPAVRARMQRQRTRDTAPELALRRVLHAAGLRFRVDAAPLPNVRRRADLVFRPSRVAVFVDGCFWHGCPEHGSRATKANAQYWSAKIEANRRRDRETDQRLAQAGWLSVRVWEHEAEGVAAQRVAAAVRERRPAPVCGAPTGGIA